MTVKVNGVKIKRILSVSCSPDDEYETQIRFYIDKRLENCTDPESINGFEVVNMESKSDDFLDYAILTIPNDKNIICTIDG